MEKLEQIEISTLSLHLFKNDDLCPQCPPGNIAEETLVFFIPKLAFGMMMIKNVTKFRMDSEQQVLSKGSLKLELAKNAADLFAEKTTGYCTHQTMSHPNYFAGMYQFEKFINLNNLKCQDGKNGSVCSTLIWLLNALQKQSFEDEYSSFAY